MDLGFWRIRDVSAIFLFIWKSWKEGICIRVYPIRICIWYGYVAWQAYPGNIGAAVGGVFHSATNAGPEVGVNAESGGFNVAHDIN